MPRLLFKILVFLILLQVGNVVGANTLPLTPEKKINFLVLSDIHFDPFADCKKSHCPLISKLKSAPVDEWETIFAENQVKPSSYRSDTNSALFFSMLNAAKQAAIQNNVKWVLILGDFLGHDFRRYYRRYTHDHSQQGYQQFVKKTFAFISNQLENAFPYIDIFALVGNNDTYNRDYYVAPNGPFLKDLQSVWSQLIKEPAHVTQMQKTFSHAGYYSVDLANQNIKLIMLNTVLFSKYSGHKLAAIYAEKQLNWLQKELQVAQLRQQKVVIGMHIPMSLDIYATLRLRLFTLINFWQKKYSQAFQNLLMAYAPNILGVIAGHLHSDWFQVVSFANGRSIPAMGVPAISPLIGNNPSFKIYTFSTDNGQLENYKTYFLPLNQDHLWKLEYDFHTNFLPSCKYCNLIELVTKI